MVYKSLIKEKDCLGLWKSSGLAEKYKAWKLLEYFKFSPVATE